MSIPVGSSGLLVYIDPGVSQMWLPVTICDLLAQAFGLIYDPDEDIYLINSTAHAILVADNPQLTLTFAAPHPYTDTVNIVLPYAALTLPLGQPYYNETVEYFPMRRANTHVVLGRVFLQEAYLIVHWERNNFTLGQVVHEGGVSRHVVPISPLPPVPSAHDLGLNVVVGVLTGCGGIVVTILLALVFTYKHLKRWTHPEVPGSAEPNINNSLAAGRHDWPIEQATVPCDVKEVDEDLEAAAKCHELHGEPVVSMLMSTPVYELPGGHAEHELAGQEPPSQPIG